jgi:ABC-2 type transport system permease protein
MNLQRVFALSKKDLKKTVRDPAVLFMVFLFPIIFVVAFGSSLGGASSGEISYHVGVVNFDGSGSSSGQFLYALTDTGIFSLQIYADNQTAQTELSQGKIQALMIIPNDFSQSVDAFEAAPKDGSRWVNTSVSLYLDKGSIVATQAVPPIIQQVLGSFTSPTQQTISSPLRLETASLVNVKSISGLDFIAPGMFTFASIFLIMIVGQSFAQNRENGMMKRVRISPTTPTEFMSSQVLLYMVIALIQAALVFVMVYALGFKPNVGIPAYAIAFVLVLVFSLSNVGFGLITATIAKSPGAATGIAFLFVIPQLFLGTFVGASLSEGAKVAGQFVPSYYVTDALTSLFLRGADLTSATILIDFGVVSASCMAILAVGIALYARYYKI